ncbi:MAG: T9SS type A sorting domain-containing protein [Bacteroidetes bacterium]|nr:T9SS type A sorting domain-containing protein [Bacteroidota bacterium]
MHKALRFGFICLISFILGVNESYAFQVNAFRFASVSGNQQNEELGSILRKANVSGDNLPEVFIGAPGASESGLNSTGRIYLLSLPVQTDTNLTSSNIIISGSVAGERLGERFELGDFNGDGKIDIVVSEQTFNGNNGKVLLFYGPFTPGIPKKSTEADVIINGLNEENFGSSLSVVKKSGVNKNGLFIGATGYGDFLGRAYYFEQIKSENSYTSESANSYFNGEQIFELFAEVVSAPGDINGDGEPDLIIGASKYSNTKAAQGVMYVYFGPFDSKQEYNVTDAAVKIFGRDTGGFWPGKLFTFGDRNKDELHDFGIGGSSDGKGYLALFNGRFEWPDSLTIGISTDEKNSHSLIQASASFSKGFGFSADVDGDFNFDGSKNLLIGAPNSSNFTGASFITYSNGSNSLTIPDGIMNSESKFGFEVMSLPNTNTIEEDPFKINDFIVSAPAANAPTKFNSIKSGVLSVFSGKLNPPSASLSFTNNTKVALIGDSIEVSITTNKGSRPIVYNKLSITYSPRGQAVSSDSLILPIDESSTVLMKFGMSEAGQIRLTQLVRDDLDVERVATQTMYFAEYPNDFNLKTNFFSTILIEGSRKQQIKFESEPSSDNNGATIEYDLLLSPNENSFTNGSGFSILKKSSSPTFTLTYEELNSYLIGRGFINLNDPNQIYWSIRARNSIGSVSLFSKMAVDGPRILPFMRLGLDPTFSISSTINRKLNLEGVSTDVFTFNWTSLVSENPNAVVDYKFVLLKDTTQFEMENPAFEKYSSPEDGNVFRLTFEETYNTLVENELFWKAKSDTVRWFYTVLAIIDGQIQEPWLPDNRFGKASIYYTVLFDIDVATESDVFSSLPKDFEIYPNFPNPFNPTTQLKFGIPDQADVKILVFNMLGQTVYKWQASLLSAGYHEHPIDAEGWSSGIYIYQIQVGNKRLTGKMSLVK